MLLSGCPVAGPVQLMTRSTRSVSVASEPRGRISSLIRVCSSEAERILPARMMRLPLRYHIDMFVDGEWQAVSRHSPEVPQVLDELSLFPAAELLPDLLGLRTQGVHDRLSGDAQFTDAEDVLPEDTHELIDVVGFPQFIEDRFVRREIAVGENVEAFGRDGDDRSGVPFAAQTEDDVDHCQAGADDQHFAFMRCDDAGLEPGVAAVTAALADAGESGGCSRQTVAGGEHDRLGLDASSLFVTINQWWSSRRRSVTSCCTISTLTPGGSRRSCCSNTSER